MSIFTKDDLLALNERRKQKRKYPFMQLVVASKTGRNAQGDGANRSVVLGTWDGKKWFQAEKFWGTNNEERAKKFVKEWKQVQITK